MKRIWRWLHSQFRGGRTRHTTSHTKTITELRQVKRRAEEVRRTLARIEAQVEAVTRDRQD